MLFRILNPESLRKASRAPRGTAGPVAECAAAPTLCFFNLEGRLREQVGGWALRFAELPSCAAWRRRGEVRCGTGFESTDEQRSLGQAA